ncbi:MAG: hypothetical protein AAFY39_10715, partial [Pseudomonadota bacterium]
MNAPLKHTADATTVEEGLAIAEAQDQQYNDEMATETAMANTLLTPRFYTTDFDELDAIDVSSVRADWDQQGVGHGRFGGHLVVVLLVLRLGDG